MLNKDKYFDEIIKIVEEGHRLAVRKDNHKPCSCDCISNCKKECLFSTSTISTTCSTNRKKWLNSEYVDVVTSLPEDIKVDTAVLVSNDGDNWLRRYFASANDSEVSVFPCGTTSWSCSLPHVYETYRYAKLPDYEQ